MIVDNSLFRERCDVSKAHKEGAKHDKECDGFQSEWNTLRMSEQEGGDDAPEDDRAVNEYKVDIICADIGKNNIRDRIRGAFKCINRCVVVETDGNGKKGETPDDRKNETGIRELMAVSAPHVGTECFHEREATARIGFGSRETSLARPSHRLAMLAAARIWLRRSILFVTLIIHAKWIRIKSDPFWCRGHGENRTRV